jgi:hypothetical protein
MRKLVGRVYLRGFSIATALIAFGLLAQSAFAGECGGWG